MLRLAGLETARKRDARARGVAGQRRALSGNGGRGQERDAVVGARGGLGGGRARRRVEKALGGGGVRCHQGARTRRAGPSEKRRAGDPPGRIRRHHTAFFLEAAAPSARAMARFRRKVPSRAERIASASPMALVPYVDKSTLQGRLEKHVALMADLLRKGLDYTSIPKPVLATIVRDYQTAGLDVPTQALRAVSNTTPRMPAPKKRPAPLAFTPLPETRSFPDAFDVGDSSRENLIRRGYNPKIGGPNVPPAMPYTGAARKMPYAPVNRYTVGASARAADSIAATNWLPPWMVEGDQPNQFVKTPQPMSMGIGPSFSYVTEQAQRLPSPAVQAFNARTRAGLGMPLPYTGRITIPGQRVFRAAAGGGGGGFAAVFASPATQVLADIGRVPIPVPNVGPGDILPNGIQRPVRRTRLASEAVPIPVPNVGPGDIIPDGIQDARLPPLRRRRVATNDLVPLAPARSASSRASSRARSAGYIPDYNADRAADYAAHGSDLDVPPSPASSRAYSRSGSDYNSQRAADVDAALARARRGSLPVVERASSADLRAQGSPVTTSSAEGSPESPLDILNADDLRFIEGGNVFRLQDQAATPRQRSIARAIIQSPELRVASDIVRARHSADIAAARGNRARLDAIRQEMEREISDEVVVQLRRGNRARRPAAIFSPSEVAREEMQAREAMRRPRSRSAVSMLNSLSAELDRERAGRPRRQSRRQPPARGDVVAAIRESPLFRRQQRRNN